MGITQLNFFFFMHLGCPFQESFTPMQFIERLSLPLAMACSDHQNGVDPEAPRDQDQGRLIKVRLEGNERMLKRGEIRDTYNDFLGHARGHCHHCPINKSEHPFACVGVLPLPLSPKGEKWLFEQFDPPEPEHSYFVEHIQLSRLPARRHEMLLGSTVEFKRPVATGVPDLTSTQLFYYLLNMREIAYESRLRLLYEFGVLRAKAQQVNELSALIAAAADGGGALIASPELDRIRKTLEGFKIRMRYEKTDDESIAMLKQYFLFCLRSLGAGVKMYASLM